MYKYLILQNPGHNRVYYKSSGDLAVAELTIASNRFSSLCSEFQIEELAGIRYISFQSEKELAEKDLDIISKLSFVFAIYKLVKSDDLETLLPIAKINYEYLDNKISSLLKYQGKTNELFTKMMLNLALLSSDFDYKTINLLDPVAGKGTTLFEALVYGFNAYGVELQQKSVHETDVFFRKYLEEERYKHHSSKAKVAGKSKHDAINLQTYEFARNKDEFKAGDTKKFGMISGDTQRISEFFPKNNFHLLVGDLPYGISHTHKSKDKDKSPSRNPSELVALCLPGWMHVLKKGGVIALSWNSHLIPKSEFAKIFKAYGMEVLSGDAYDNLEHQVDRSIKRDVIFAKKI